MIQEGFADAPLTEAVSVFNALLDYFADVDKSSLPTEVNIFAMPEYPVKFLLLLLAVNLTRNFNSFF